MFWAGKIKYIAGVYIFFPLIGSVGSNMPAIRITHLGVHDRLVYTKQPEPVSIGVHGLLICWKGSAW